MKSWQHILLGALLGLLCSAVIYLIAVPPKGNPIILQPLPTPAPIVVYIRGAVHQPGIYALSSSSRVNDAITAAGGFLDTADENSINLAQKVSDGDRIDVLLKGETRVILAPVESGSTVDASPSFPININTASQNLLETLPGIGPTRASEIISYREANGSFMTIEDLKRVPGIGDGTFKQIQGMISVD
jgi:competence protein ComEA